MKNGQNEFNLAKYS